MKVRLASLATSLSLLCGLALLLAAALVTFPAQADDSPYNKGVAAWRLKDNAEARIYFEQITETSPDTNRTPNSGFSFFVIGS